MSDLKRYEVESVDPFDVNESATGTYVFYDDISAAFTSQAVQLHKLKTEVQKLQEVAKKIRAQLVCIGGPLNDNVKQYNKEQLADLYKIFYLVDDIGE